MNSLNDPQISARISYLHKQAKGDEQRWQARKAAQESQPKSSEPDPLIRLGEFYIPVSEDEGHLLYMLARARNAQLIVEFGASFGISTLYLAAAARDSGGKLITTEVHPEKCAALRDSF
ncbi:MAG: methyltransferase, partial [Pseudomonadota bacterium]